MGEVLENSVWTDFKVNLYPDSFGATYVSPLYVGENATRMDVVCDTGSDWLVLEGSKCTSCKGNTFDGDISGTKLTKDLSQRKYGSVVLLGHEYTDKVCIDPLNQDTCVENFKYYLID